MTDKFVVLPNIPSTFQYPKDLDLNTKPAKYNKKKGFSNFITVPPVYLPVAPLSTDSAEKENLLIYKNQTEIGSKKYEAIDKGITNKIHKPEIEKDLIETSAGKETIKSKKRSKVISTPSIYPTQLEEVTPKKKKIGKSKIKIKD